MRTGDLSPFPRMQIKLQVLQEKQNRFRDPNTQTENQTNRLTYLGIKDTVPMYSEHKSYCFLVFPKGREQYSYFPTLLIGIQGFPTLQTQLSMGHGEGKPTCYHQLLMRTGAGVKSRVRWERRTMRGNGWLCQKNSTNSDNHLSSVPNVIWGRMKKQENEL